MYPGDEEPVLRQHNNLKRCIASLAMMLALSPGFLQAHWFCELGGCPIAANELDKASSEGAACCHSHDCHASKTTAHEECNQNHDGSCPCPPECACHQAPQPLELPRSAPEPTDLLLQGFEYAGATTIVLPISNGLAPHHLIWDNAALAETSVERCAHLCRFLI